MTAGATARLESVFVLVAGSGAISVIGRRVPTVEFASVAKEILGLGMADLTNTLDRGSGRCKRIKDAGISEERDGLCGAGRQYDRVFDQFTVFNTIRLACARKGQCCFHGAQNGQRIRGVARNPVRIGRVGRIRYQQGILKHVRRPVLTVIGQRGRGYAGRSTSCFCAHIIERRVCPHLVLEMRVMAGAAFDEIHIRSTGHIAGMGLDIRKLCVRDRAVDRIMTINAELVQRSAAHRRWRRGPIGRGSRWVVAGVTDNAANVVMWRIESV